MRLRSTREWLCSALALKAATRRLSCTTWACSRLRRRATSGAWRMASMSWQDLPPAAARLHMQPTDCSPMFDSLQLGPGAPAAIFTIISGEVAVVFPAAAITSDARKKLHDARSCTAVTAAGRCQGHGATKRRPWRLAAAQGSGDYLRSTRASRPRAPGSSGGASRSTARALLSWLPKKSAHGSGRFSSFLRA